MIQKPTVHTAEGDLTMVRHDAAQEFHCGRCDTDKKAKNVARRVLPDGSADLICNGCYGNILSRN